MAADCTTASGYGRHLYGRGRFGGWPGAARPYGVGAYGAGPYARYGANIFCLAGASGVIFNVRAAQPSLRIAFVAPASITFLPRIAGFARVFYPQALTQIAFSVHAEGVLAWADTAPCRTGAWAQVMCGAGAWEVVEGCSVGTWAGTELVR